MNTPTNELKEELDENCTCVKPDPTPDENNSGDYICIGCEGKIQ